MTLWLNPHYTMSSTCLALKLCALVPNDNPPPHPQLPLFSVPHLFLQMWQLVATEEDGHHVFLQVIVNVHGLTLVLLVPVLPCGDQATKHLAETKHTETGENSRQGCEEIQKLWGWEWEVWRVVVRGNIPHADVLTLRISFSCVFFLDDQKLD